MALRASAAAWQGRVVTIHVAALRCGLAVGPPGIQFPDLHFAGYALCPSTQVLSATRRRARAVQRVEVVFQLEQLEALVAARRARGFQQVEHVLRL